jgi:hypothetical protein
VIFDADGIVKEDDDGSVGDCDVGNGGNLGDDSATFVVALALVVVLVVIGAAAANDDDDDEVNDADGVSIELDTLR